MRRILKGIPVSPGVVQGPLVWWKDENPCDAASRTPELVFTSLEGARQLWAEARIRTAELLDRLAAKTASEVGPEAAEIFAAHKMILEDPTLEEMVLTRVDQGKDIAESVSEAVESLAAQFEAVVDNAYMRERAADIRDVGARLLSFLRGTGRRMKEAPVVPSILAARDLAPSHTAELDKSLLLGMVLETGGPTSHTAILARGLGIPAVVSVAGLLEASGETVLVDGDEGIVIIDPSPDDIERYGPKLRGGGLSIQSWESVSAPEAVTLDGTRVRLAANIGSFEELAAARKYGLCEVGLCRTEFMFIGARRMPSEDEQFDAYRRIAEEVNPHPVVFRTLDVGGDKEIPCLSVPKEENPFLGLRGLRFCLAYRDVFKTQLRALLRASAYGSVRIMFPMVATLEEYRQAMEVAKEAQAELEAAGIRFDPEVKWGIMVEVPAAALMAEKFAREVDFLSIGTNDLIQYTIAIDRLNERVSYLYQPFHPAVLNLIDSIIRAAHKYGKEVGMCGEMAGMREAAPLLLGLGLDKFSMAPPSAPEVRKVLAGTTLSSARSIAEMALQCSTAEEVATLVREA